MDVSLMIECWSIDVKTCRMDIALNRRRVPGDAKRFEFMEKPEEPPLAVGFDFFLKNKLLSGDATGEEIEFIKALTSDPLHFPGPGQTG